MPDLLLTTIEYSNYISPFKFVIFLVLFFFWLPLLTWVYEDTKAVGTRVVFWTSIVFAAGVVSILLWLLLPMFIIGMLVFIIAVGATSLSYVMHRNSRVMDYDRVLTAEHIKSLFSKDSDKEDALKDFVFITANDNEVPFPEARTPDFFGYKAAHDLFLDATWRRADSILFLPTQQEYNITYFVDGAALKQPAMPREQMDFCFRFLKHVADLDPDEKRKPQKGKFEIRQEDVSTEWEMMTAGSTAGEQIQLKRVTRLDISKLADISLTPVQLEQLNNIRDANQGVFIVAGSPRSGVTTTFYALIRSHDPFMYNVNTLEREPTAELLNVTQNIYALSDSGTTTFAKKLQAVVRMGPDVVGVADCQDAETAKICAKAARDSKIIYLTMNAENVVQAFGKWLKLVGDRDLAVDNLLGVSNQRILRKLCSECKEAYEPNKEILRKFNIPADKAKVFYRPGKVQYDKHGKPSTCEHCQGTGFFGRMCVFESIIMNDSLKRAIKQVSSLSDINTQFRRAKMLYLQEQALLKVLDGTTSINEMVRIFSPSKKPKQKK